MSFTEISKPTQGDPTKKSIVDAVIDNLNHLKGQVDAIKIGQVPNGSFETDSDGMPIQWEFTSFPGGTAGIDATDSSHGAQCFKITSPGGSGNGGGYIVSSEFFEVTENDVVKLAWEHKSSVAGIYNIVQILWFAADLTSNGSSTLYDSTSNPTDWTMQKESVTPPADSRFCKIKIIGADSSNTTAGTAYFDNVHFWSNANPGMKTFTASDTFAVPDGVTQIRVRAWGGGAAGVNGAVSQSGGGGGAGAYGEGIFDVSPGDEIEVAVGAGGGFSGSTAQAGGTTSVGSLLTVAGGSAGALVTGGNGGSAPTVPDGGVALAGGNGRGGTLLLGGCSPFGGIGGRLSTESGFVPGGGGAGGGNSQAGGSGAAGMVIIYW